MARTLKEEIALLEERVKDAKFILRDVEWQVQQLKSLDPDLEDAIDQMLRKAGQ